MGATAFLNNPRDIADRITHGDEAALDLPTMVHWLEGGADVHALIEAASLVRRTYFGNKVHLCSIVNAKQGGCSEDCGFCSQSRHAQTDVDAERFLTADEIVDASRHTKARGATALGLVTATRGLEAGSTALAKVIEGVRAVREAGHTEAHGSFGLLDEEALEQLVAAGLTELNHNLETGRGYFDKVVTSHSYEQRIATIRRAKALGLRTCVGGIIGMGEEPVHRAELAMELRALDVDEVPLNFLVSIDGTRLAHHEPLAPIEMLRAIACFRLALPAKNIFIAAGRLHLGQLQPLMFSAGASGMMIGDLLTTPNRSVQDDLDMIFELGLAPESCGGSELPTAARERATPRVRPGHLPVLQA